VFHITELRRGEVQALHLCESCAKEYLSQPAEDSFPKPPGVETETETEDEDAVEQPVSRVCPNCGISFKEFRSGGRLGCPHDYVAFQEELLPLIENIHSEVQHCGKSPRREPNASQRQYKLVRLRTRLKAAVEEELYEEAARLRDEILLIENELSVVPTETE
jgi:protein arginine kinase activator